MQGSYKHKEASESSDIDIVVILNELTIQDLKKYRAIISQMPYKEKACGFISGKSENIGWEKSDLFQFYYDTELIKILNKNGWILMSNEYEPDMSLVFNKGYTPDGFAEKVYHLHVRYLDDWNELYFRDYLIDNPDVAAQYVDLKLSLWKEYEHSRDGYTEAKSEFIRRYTEKAKFEYAGRYLFNK